MMSMISPDKKNLASLIVEGPKTEKVSDNETDYSAGYEAAGQDIAQAIEKKDLKLLVQGLKDLFDMFMDEHCDEGKEIEEDESGMEGEDKASNWK